MESLAILSAPALVSVPPLAAPEGPAKASVAPASTVMTPVLTGKPPSRLSMPLWKSTVPELSRPTRTDVVPAPPDLTRVPALLKVSVPAALRPTDRELSALKFHEAPARLFILAPLA